MKKVGKKAAESEKTAAIGRPRIENPRNLRLPVRFSPQEIDELRIQAAKRGERLSDYVRIMLDLGATGYGA